MDRITALGPALIAVALVVFAAREATGAARTGIACLGSMPSAVALAVAGFVSASVAAGIWLQDVRVTAERTPADTTTPTARRAPLARRWAAVGPVLALLCFSPVAAAGLRTYDDPRPVALHGFATGTSAPPQTGIWTATGTYRFSEGLGGRGAGDTITRTLAIRRVCRSSGCDLLITRTYADPPMALTTPLQPSADGWHALFPALHFACSSQGPPTTSDATSAPMRSQWILRFGDGGRTLEARERIFVFRRGCQYRNALVEWSAVLTAPYMPPMPPAGAGRPADVA